MLLAECVVVRPVVLAPLALRASGTLNAGRGAKARRARRRGRRLPHAEVRAAHTAAGSCGGSRLVLVRVMREGARAAPAPARESLSGGGLSRCLRLLGHDSNQHQALIPVSKRPAGSHPRGARSRHESLTDRYGTAPLVSNSRAPLGRGLSPAGAVARPLHCGLLGSRAAPRR